MLVKGALCVAIYAKYAISLQLLMITLYIVTQLKRENLNSWLICIIHTLRHD